MANEQDKEREAARDEPTYAAPEAGDQESLVPGTSGRGTLRRLDTTAQPVLRELAAEATFSRSPLRRLETTTRPVLREEAMQATFGASTLRRLDTTTRPVRVDSNDKEQES
jgi:hypothetical protein